MIIILWFFFKKNEIYNYYYTYEFLCFILPSLKVKVNHVLKNKLKGVVLLKLALWLILQFG